MAGNKNSGRRPRSIEQRRIDTLEESWEIIGTKLRSALTPQKEKERLAEALVLRSVPQNIKGEGFNSNHVLIWRVKEANGSYRDVVRTPPQPMGDISGSE